MADRCPATVTQPVRALDPAVHDLTTERHEPDEPRGSRPDLWGAAGEIPAVYPAVARHAESTRQLISSVVLVTLACTSSAEVGMARRPSVFVRPLSMDEGASCNGS